MKRLFFIFAVTGLLATSSMSQVPQTITHQGFLADSAGQPVTGTLPMTVRLFTDSLSGTEALAQSFLTVNINSGVYTLSIDVSTLSSGWPLNQYWLEMEVNTSVLSPRIRLTSVPYALYASKTDTASQLADANSDTRVDVNDGFDPEVIHFHVAGTERWAMRGTRLEPVGGGGNLFIGLHAGRIHNLTANDNTYVGNEAGYNSSIGLRNSFFGRSAGITNSSGSDNSFFGKDAGYSTTSGNRNTAVGAGALRTNSEGNYNVASGYQALFSNTTGSSNTANGYQALYDNTLGENNTANGFGALLSNTTGFDNTAFGANAGYSNYDGISNSFFGKDAGLNNNAGDGNSYFGAGAGHDNTAGTDNSCFGAGAGFFGRGYSNSFFGSGAGASCSSGVGNVSIGYNSGFGNFTGYSNTYVGSSAGPINQENQFSNATILGAGAVATASNQVRIGDNTVTSIGGYASWTNISDGRFKSNMAEDVKGLDFILKLRPVTYNLDMVGLEKALHPDQSRLISKMGSKESAQMTAMNQAAAEAKSKVRYSGFVAQEVEQAAKALGYDFSGIDAPKNDKDFYGLRYAEFVVPLVKAVQEQQVIIEELKAEVAKLQARVK